MPVTIETKKLIYPELSYKIIGVAFDVFNKTGFGMSEKYYQKLFTAALAKENISYTKEQFVNLSFDGRNIGRYFLDFVVDNKIVVEIKVRPRFGYVHIKQVVSYLRSTGYKLGLIIYFTRDGVRYRRIVNAID